MITNKNLLFICALLLVFPAVCSNVGIQLTSGWLIGFDLFFVLSGFTITAFFLEKPVPKIKPQILSALANLLPMMVELLLALSVTFFLCVIFFEAIELIEASKALLASLIFLSNLYFWKAGEFIDPVIRFNPFFHTWIISIWFQCVFFLFLLFKLRSFFPKPWLFVAILVAAATLSFMVAEYAKEEEMNAGFFLMPSRVWEFLLGSGAFLLRKRLTAVQIPNFLKLSLLLLCWGVIIASFALFEASTYPGLATLPSTLALVMILAITATNSTVKEMYDHETTKKIGRTLYSIFIWHQPIIVFPKRISGTDLDINELLLIFGIILVVAYNSRSFVDFIFRIAGNLSNISVKVISASFVCSLLFFGLLGVNSGGLPGRNIGPEVSDWNFDNRHLMLEVYALSNSVAAAHGHKSIHEFENVSWFNDKNTKSIIVIGNSYARDMFHILSKTKLSKTVNVSVKTVREFQDVLDGENNLFQNPNFKGADLVLISHRYYDFDIENLDAFLKEIVKMKKNVVLIENPHEFNFNSGKTLADVIIGRLASISDLQDISKQTSELINSVYFHQYKNNISKRPTVSAINETIKKLASKYGFTALNRMKLFCNEKQKLCEVVGPKLEKYFYDEGHVSLQGMSFFAKQIDNKAWLAPFLDVKK